MKILLVAVNAKYTHMNPALYSIKAFAGDAGKCMEIAEYTINQYPKDVLKDIYERCPQVIGFSCYIWNMDFIGRILEDLGKVLPKSLILLGGPEAAFDTDRIFARYDAVGGVFTGEGEKAWKTLAENLLLHEDISGIPGLLMRGREGFEQGTETTDLDDIPFIYDDPGQFENRMLYYETSRGCPFRCSYCLSSIDRNMRFRSLEKVYPELQRFLDDNIKIVKFIDRTFNADRNHAMGIWRYLEEHDNGVSRFHFEIEADLLKDEELEFLSTVRSGLFQFEVGVQSVNQETLNEINRYADIDRIRSVVKKLISYGNIPVHVDLIAGLPFEDIDSFRNSFNEVYSWGADELQLGFLKVLKGTEIETKAEKFGLIYESSPPYEVLKTKWLRYDDIIHLKDIEEQLERYGNSGSFRFTMAEYEKFFSDAFAMYEYMAAYYHDHADRFAKQSRISAYGMLRRMIIQRLDEIDEAFIDFDMGMAGIKQFDALLMIDLYAKEKLKVRPSFFPDPERQKHLQREYLKANGPAGNVHVEFFDFDVGAFLRGEEAGRVSVKDDAFSCLVFTYEGQGAASVIEAVGPCGRYRIEGDNIRFDIK